MKLKTSRCTTSKLPWVALGLFATVLLSGCEGPPSSLRPLYTIEEGRKLPQNDLLKGKWVMTTMDSAVQETSEIEKSSDDFQDFDAEITSDEPGANGAYLLVLRPRQFNPELDYVNLRLALVPIGARTFFDVTYRESLQSGRKLEPLNGSFGVNTHWFGSLRIEPDFLRFTLPDRDILASYAPDPSEDVDSSIALFQNGVFAGSTKQLREAMLKDSDEDEVRHSGVYFCRPGADCPLAIVEDRLKTYPQDSWILDEAANFFMARGDYGRATALFRRSKDLPLVRGKQPPHLGLALALAGNYEEARREFADEASSLENSEDVCAQIIWTHFVEGSFSEVIRTADGCRATKEKRSAEPILLKYFCLLRLGKRAEAENYLSPETQNFVGDATEHILLLKFQGRLQERPSATDALWLRRRFAFFNGLQSEAAGHTADAVTIFQNPIFSRKDSLIALAARTEVNRLKAANPGK